MSEKEEFHFIFAGYMHQYPTQMDVVATDKEAAIDAIMTSLTVESKREKEEMNDESDVIAFIGNYCPKPKTFLESSYLREDHALNEKWLDLKTWLQTTTCTKLKYNKYMVHVSNALDG